MSLSMQPEGKQTIFRKSNWQIKDNCAADAADNT
jgi:hypothetical protein